MMKKRNILLLPLLLLLNIHGVVAQWNRDRLSETMQRYGAPVTFMHDSIRPYFIAHMNVVGYIQCYNDYYDILCQAAEQSLQRKDSLMYDLGMSRLFMSWQNGKISASDARAGMNQLMNDCKKRYGITSFCYSTLAVIMAEFNNSTGNFIAADTCYRRVINYKEYNQNVRTWQFSMALHAKMVAEVGSGKLSDVGNTIDKIWDIAKTTNYNYNIGKDMLRTQKLSEVEKKMASTLAQQMTLDFLPPSPNAIARNSLEPWPLEQTVERLEYGESNVLAVFQLYELLFKLHLSHEFDNFINFNIARMRDNLDTDFYSSHILSEMHRREAMIVKEHEEKLDTLKYPHNLVSNSIIRRWNCCIGSEQLFGGERSALSLLSFSMEWIRKGYPINVLPFVEEAADVMRRNFSYQRPTFNQLQDRRHNKEWLAKELPKLVSLVKGIPEYVPSIETFKSLAK